MLANIQLEKDKFTISFEKVLPTSVKFQIKYYNFSQIDLDNDLVFIALKNSVKFESLITFLKENNIDVSLCQNSKDYLNLIFKEKQTTSKECQKLTQKIKRKTKKNNKKSIKCSKKPKTNFKKKQNK